MQHIVQTVTLTLTKEELADLRMAVHDSSSYWYSHLCKSQENENYHLTEPGCKLLWERRRKLYDQMSTLYNLLFENKEV